MARWTSEQLEKSNAKKAPSTSGRVKSTGNGRQLVEIEIIVNGHKETHYVFEGSELETYWNNRAAEPEKKAE